MTILFSGNRQRMGVLLLLCGLLWQMLPVPQSYAQDVTDVEETIITFAGLDVPEQHLRGPFDAASIDFSLPASWELTDGAALQLQFTTFFADGAAMTATEPTAADEPGTAVNSGRAFGGTLEVVLNDVLLETVLLDQMGERTLTVPLSTKALQVPLGGERHVLKILLDTDEQCGIEQYTSLVIRASSHLQLPHRIVPPPTDLANLPYPLYQHALLPDAATIVVPDDPTANELQAALAIAAGLGRMTDDEFELVLRPLDALTDTRREQTHLIFVGRPADFPLPAEVELPAPVADDAFALPGVADDDGVIQMAVSPWNATKVLLIAGGTSDAAVVKAAQALSSGALRTGVQPDLAVIAAVQPDVTSSFFGIDQTLGDLGYETQKMYGMGGQYAGYRFDIPPGQEIDGEAYLDLVFVHSGLLDYEQSGLMVSLNEEPIAGVRLDDTSTRLGSTRLALPATALRPGSNLITVRADLLPRALCIDPRSSGLWMSIRPESLLHLPLTPAQDSTPADVIDLGYYPQPFTVQTNLSDLAFVLDPTDPAGWEVAAQIAFDLGPQMQGALVDLAVAYADAVPEQMRAERNLLVVGRPTRLPLLDELGSALPAPFAAGSDLASAPNAPIVYRMAEEVSVGYLQLLTAPWNDERAILTVLGSSDTGLEWAGAALTTPELRSKLAGNLAVVQAEQIESSDTRTRVTTETTPPETVESEEEATVALERPDILLFVAVASIALVALGSLVFGVVWWRRRRMQHQLATE